MCQAPCQVFYITSSQELCETGINTPTLQMRRLRLKDEVTWPSPQLARTYLGLKPWPDEKGTFNYYAMS